MRKTFVFLFFQLLYVAVHAQSIAPKLADAYAKLINDPQAKYAITSLCVLDAKTGQTLFAKNENIGLATASTLKTITSATAFSLLGEDFKFETKLVYSGKIDADGTLNGNILIIGSGDPTLGSNRYEETKPQTILERFTNAIKKLGIKKINGRIVGDDSLFGTQNIPDGWTWQDIGNYFGAGCSALSWCENQFDVFLSAGRQVGDAVKLTRTDPLLPHLKIVNELKTGSNGSGDNAYAYLPAYGNVAYLRGTWGIDIAKPNISVAMPDPAFEMARQLDLWLKSKQIAATFEPTTTRRLALTEQKSASATTEIYTHFSPSLNRIIYWFQKKSINLYGEALLKTIALKTGKMPSTKNGAETEKAFWATKGFDKNALNIIDGSGLSPATRVNTMTMAKILYWAQSQPWFSSYLSSFPEYNDMTIKSGTINDVSAFAGYYFAGNNKYVVVININNYNGSGINKKLFATLDALK